MEIPKQTTAANKSSLALALGFVCAIIVYLALSLFLYYPYLSSFGKIDLLLIVCPVAAGLGANLLCRHWTDNPLAALLTGAFYGFSPFALSLGAYHPFTLLLIAVIPWLFMPAAIFDQKRSRSITVMLLAMLPPIVIVIFFVLLAAHPFFPIPVTVKPSFAGFISSTPTASSPLPLGYYHIGSLLFLIGLIRFAFTHRIVTIILAAAGLVIAFYGPFLNVSPAIWTLLPILFGAILIGQVIQWLSEISSKGKIATSIIALCIAIDFIYFATKVVDAIL